MEQTVMDNQEEMETHYYQKKYQNLENIEKVAASNYHQWHQGKDGSVYTWGYNGNGQLGNGTTISNSIPTKYD